MSAPDTMPVLKLTIAVPISEETANELRPRPLDWPAVRAVVLDAEPYVDLISWDFEEVE